MSARPSTSQPVSDLRTRTADDSASSSPSSSGSSTSTPKGPSAWALWGHQATDLPGPSQFVEAELTHPFKTVEEHMASRGSRLGMVDYMREKYGKTSAARDSSSASANSAPTPTMGESHSRTPREPTTSSQGFPPASAQPSVEGTSGLAGPSSNLSTSREGGVLSSKREVPPAWGMWSNPQAVQEIAALHTTPKSKSPPSAASTRERLAKKQRRTSIPETPAGEPTEILTASPDRLAQPPPVPPLTTNLPSIRPLLGSADDRGVPSSSSSSAPTSSTSGQSSRSEQTPRLPSFSALAASDSSSSYHHHPQTPSSYPSSSSSSSHYPPTYYSSRPPSSSTHHLYPPSFSGHPSPQPSQHEIDPSGGRRSPPSNRSGWSDQQQYVQHSHQRIPSLSVSSDRCGSGTWERNDQDEADSPLRRTRTSSAAEQGNGQGKSQAAFVVKLYQMLEDPELQGAIEWRSDTSFVVPDPEYFARVVCPQQFKHSNWQSFVRQLNMYGFSKVSSEWQSRPSTSIPPSPPSQQVADTQGWEFRHPSFIRGQTHLLPHIERKAVKAADKKTPGVLAHPTPTSATNYSAITAPSPSGSTRRESDDLEYVQRSRRPGSSSVAGEDTDGIHADQDETNGERPSTRHLHHTSVPSHRVMATKSEVWTPSPSSPMSPALAAMNDRVTLLEEGLYHARMDSLHAQRELARSVLVILEDGTGDDLRALKSRLEIQREDWTRRQLDLARERSGGEAPPPSGSANEGGPAGRVAGGGGPKGILGLLNS